MFPKKSFAAQKLSFILIGAQKSGTTALHYHLAKHPRIALGDQQEMHFFDDESIFDRAPDYDLLHGHYSGVAPSLIAGECTPSYLYWAPAAERIHRYNPQIKLIALLRNPVDRAFAHWNMQCFKGRESLDFLEAIRAEKERIAQPLSLESRRFSYLDRGFYTTQLTRFLKLFAREQMRIIKFEEFKNRPLETINSIFQFLGLPPSRSFRNKDRNVVPYSRAMTLQERGQTYGMFAEEIANLERLLEWDCSDWKESSV